jgi:hypothetical protein
VSDRPFDFSAYRGGASSGGAGDPISPPPAEVALDLPGLSPTPSYEPFGASALPAPAALAAARPPLQWLWAALAAGLVGLALAAVDTDHAVLTVIAWLITGPVAFGLLSTFTSADTRQRARALYVSPTWAPMAYWVVTALVLLAVVGSALRIAEWVGRL